MRELVLADTASIISFVALHVSEATPPALQIITSLTFPPSLADSARSASGHTWPACILGIAESAASCARISVHEANPLIDRPAFRVIGSLRG